MLQNLLDYNRIKEQEIVEMRSAEVVTGYNPNS